MDLPSFIRSLDPGDVVAAIDAAAKLFDEKPGAVKNWLYGVRYPRPATGRKIVERTNGKVPLSGIYGERE
jgi:hypothetical protein